MVIGASGHARCVIDAARAGSTGEVVAVADDDVVPTAREVLGVPVVGGSDSVGEWWSEGRIDGVVVGNIWTRSGNALYDSMVRTYQDVFDRLYLLDVPGSGNQILLAVGQSGSPPVGR